MSASADWKALAILASGCAIALSIHDGLAKIAESGRYQAVSGNMRFDRDAGFFEPCANVMRGQDVTDLSIPDREAAGLRAHPETAGEFDGRWGTGSAENVLGRAVIRIECGPGVSLGVR